MTRDMKAYVANRREHRRSTLIEMSGGSCQECGSTDSLEFNHIDRTAKTFGLDKRGMDYKWETILEEWRKCELLCQKHHKEKTKKQYENGDMPPSWNSMKHMPYIHGTMRMYQEKSCRCNDCKAAKREYRKGGTVYSQIVV